MHVSWAIFQLHQKGKGDCSRAQAKIQPYEIKLTTNSPTLYIDLKHFISMYHSFETPLPPPNPKWANIVLIWNWLCHTFMA